MKYAIFFTLLASLSIQALAQKVHFTDSDNIWYVKTRREVNPGHKMVFDKYRYYFDGDTTCFGKKYEKAFLDYSPGDNAPSYRTRKGLMRDDTAGKVVYIRYYYDLSKEFVLYDYDLNLSDTIPSNYQQNPNAPWWIVDSIDSLQINGVYHKRFFYKVIDPSWVADGVKPYTVIEGIGSTTDPFEITSYYQVVNEYDRFVFCFTKSQGMPAGLNYTCSDTVLNINDEIITRRIKVYPQPAYEHVIIELPERVPSEYELTVLNTLGQSVYYRKEISTRKYSLQRPGTGTIFYYQIRNNTTDQTYTGKLLFQ